MTPSIFDRANEHVFYPSTLFPWIAEIGAVYEFRLIVLSRNRMGLAASRVCTAAHRALHSARLVACNAFVIRPLKEPRAFVGRLAENPRMRTGL